MRTLPRLLSAAGAAGLILAAGLATPAHAADNGSLELQFVPVTVTVPPSPGRAMMLYVLGNNAQNPVLTIDPAGLGDEATLSALPQANCTTGAGGTATCRLPEQSTLELPLVLGVKATAKAVVGHVLHLTFTLSADNVAAQQVTGDIPIGDAVDLVAFKLTADPGQARVGDHVVAASYVANSGSRVAQGIRVTVFSDHSLAPDQYDNCAYTTTVTYEFVCDLPDAVLNPGDRLNLVDDHGNPIGFTVAPDAGTPAAGVEIVYDALADAATPPNLSRMARPSHTGHEVRLAQSAAPAAQAGALPVDANPDDNLVDFFWKLSGIHRDVAAVGATATGKVGDTVDVNVGFLDKGPAALDALRSGGDPAFAFIFLPPSNTDVVAVPHSCWSVVDNGDGTNTPTRGALHGTYYRCESASFVPVGATQTTKITLKITKATGDKGLVTFFDKYVAPDYRYKDDVAADDQADVVVGPAAGGNVLTSLPVTGAPLAVIAIAGVVILAAGAGLVLLTRTRRRA
jgi:hypothetical protein